MDLNALLNPVIRDRESFTEFVEALADQIPGIERCIADLRSNPDDRVLIATLFRGLHTIKGDAAMCHVDLGIMIAHPLESVLARLREGEIIFSELVAELVLLALDRLELAIESLASGRPLAGLKLPELVGGLELLGQSPREKLDAQAARIIETVTGFRPTAAARLETQAFAGVSSDPVGDLKFFRQAALRLEARSDLFAGRTDRLLKLALETNQSGGTPVNPSQLEAAVYMHDLGMMFLPESLWLKAGRLSAAELRQIQDHPELSAGLLERMTGWDEAARIVRQHHETPNGQGYPEHLAGDAICAGAKILAIADTYEAVTLRQTQRGQSRSLLRAVAEINACDMQFDPFWIAQFNQVIRRSLDG